jgi:hypothetical protein
MERRNPSLMASVDRDLDKDGVKDGEGSKPFL